VGSRYGQCPPSLVTAQTQIAIFDKRREKRQGMTASDKETARARKDERGTKNETGETDGKAAKHGQHIPSLFGRDVAY